MTRPGDWLRFLAVAADVRRAEIEPEYELDDEERGDGPDGTEA